MAFRGATKTKGIMPIMRKILFLPLICTVLVLMTACSAGHETPMITPSLEVTLPLFHTATATPTSTATPAGLPTPTLKPTITPTPRTYEIHTNDTLISIAYYFGVTLEELQAANPDVNPALLSIGTRLIIPPARQVTGTPVAPTPTPFGVVAGEVHCISAVTGGLDCFALIENSRQDPAEFLTGKFSLVDKEDVEVAARVVSLPINQIMPGNRIPFYAYFAPPLPEFSRVEFTLLTAAKASRDNGKYYPLVITTSEVTLASSGLSATITGSAQLASGAPDTQRITLLAVAYDQSGEVIGIHRIQLDMGLTAQDQYPFTIQAYSIDGKIASVEVYGEAIRVNE